MEDRENLKTSSHWVKEPDSSGQLRSYERKWESWTETCPFCEAPVEVSRETEEWEETFLNSNRWKHSNFGIVNAWCDDCGIVLVDTPDGLVYFSLNE